MDLSGYTEESVNVFNSALRAANAVLANMSLTIEDQKVVDDAAADLQAAIENLSADDNTGSGDNKPGDSNTPSDGNNDDKNDNNNSSNNDDKNSTTSDPNKGPMDDNKNDAPATGDTTPFLLAAVLTTVAAAGVYLFRRRVTSK